MVRSKKNKKKEKETETRETETGKLKSSWEEQYLECLKEKQARMQPSEAKLAPFEYAVQYEKRRAELRATEEEIMNKSKSWMLNPDIVLSSNCRPFAGCGESPSWYRDVARSIKRAIREDQNRKNLRRIVKLKYDMKASSKEDVIEKLLNAERRLQYCAGLRT